MARKRKGNLKMLFLIIMLFTLLKIGIALSGALPAHLSAWLASWLSTYAARHPFSGDTPVPLWWIRLYKFRIQLKLFSTFLLRLSGAPNGFPKWYATLPERWKRFDEVLFLILTAACAAWIISR
jgi:hypothetical protein